MGSDRALNQHEGGKEGRREKENDRRGCKKSGSNWRSSTDDFQPGRPADNGKV
jgi:hypothetical protein